MPISRYQGPDAPIGRLGQVGGNGLGGQSGTISRSSYGSGFRNTPRPTPTSFNAPTNDPRVVGTTYGPGGSTSYDSWNPALATASTAQYQQAQSAYKQGQNDPWSQVPQDWRSFTQPSFESHQAYDFYGNPMGYDLNPAQFATVQTANDLAKLLGARVVAKPLPGGLNNEIQQMLVLPDGTEISAGFLADEWRRNAIIGNHPEIAYQNIIQKIEQHKANLNGQVRQSDPNELMRTVAMSRSMGPQSMQQPVSQPVTPPQTPAMTPELYQFQEAIKALYGGDPYAVLGGADPWAILGQTGNTFDNSMSGIARLLNNAHALIGGYGNTPYGMNSGFSPMFTRDPLAAFSSGRFMQEPATNAYYY